MDIALASDALPQNVTLVAGKNLIFVKQVIHYSTDISEEMIQDAILVVLHHN